MHSISNIIFVLLLLIPAFWPELYSYHELWGTTVMILSAIVVIAAIILPPVPMPMTVGDIGGIVTAGVVGFAGLICVCLAFYSGFKEVPRHTLDKVDNKQHAPVPPQSTTPGVPSA